MSRRNEKDPVDAADPRGDEPAWTWTDDDFAASPDLAQDFDASLVPVTPTRPAIGAAIRRRAWVWTATALLGLMAGAAAFVLVPPPFSATTSVLLTQNPNQQPMDQILTEVALAESRTVATAAMRSLGLPLSVRAVERFSANITAVPLTNRVIQITVKATSSRAAVSAARATATAFLLIRSYELSSAERLTIASLTQQISQAKQQRQAVTAQIAALPAAGLTAFQRGKLASLQARQSGLAGSITGLEQAATTFESTAAVITASMVRGSQVLDPAIPSPRPRWRYPLLYLGGGLFGGLAVGIGFVIAAALVARQLRRRDDVSRALGSPVLLSVGHVRAGGLRGRSWPTAARQPAVRKVVAHLRRSLPSCEVTSTLAVVAVDDLRGPALALVSLASSYARDGKRVLVADLTSSIAVGRLLGLTEVGVKLVQAQGQEVLVAVPEPSLGLPEGPVGKVAPSAPPSAGEPPPPAEPLSAAQSLDKAYRTADIMLTLATLDPAVGAGHLPTWTDHAVVMLTAGRSSATKIDAVGEMIRASGIALTSAILVGADRNDESLGFAIAHVGDVSSGLATERARAVASGSGEIIASEPSRA